jgi:hypothetical protein
LGTESVVQEVEQLATQKPLSAPKTRLLKRQKLVAPVHAEQFEVGRHTVPQQAPLQFCEVHDPPVDPSVAPSAPPFVPESPPELLPLPDPESLPLSGPELLPVAESFSVDVSILASAVEASSGVVASFPADASTGTVESPTAPSPSVPESPPPEEPLEELSRASPPPSTGTNSVPPPLPVPHPPTATAVPHPTSTSAIRLFRFISLLLYQVRPLVCHAESNGKARRSAWGRPDPCRHSFEIFADE